jgi:ATP-dependent helicase/nuclease subunit A
VNRDDATRLEQDQEARRQAQIEFHRPLVLEAGAGTGKTTALVARILSWCLGEGWAAKAAELEKDQELRQGIENEEDWIAARVLEGLVAITFTEAAAAEMAERTAKGLSKVASGPETKIVGFDPSLLPNPTAPEERSARARALLGALDRLTVRTIHSYCWSLLVTHPIEAELHPELKVDADAGQTEAVARDVVEAAVKEAYAKGMKHPLARLAARGQGPREVVESLTTLSTLGVPASELADDPLSPEHIGELIEELAAKLQRVGDTGASLASAKRVDGAIQILGAVQETTDLIDSTNVRTVADLTEICRFLDGRWEKKLIDRLKKWGEDRFTASERKALGEGVTAMSVAAADLRSLLTHSRRMDPQLLDDARRALEPLLTEVERRLRARGLATFQSLLVEARDLLEKEPLVCARERRSIDQLLVDEFQDTDRIQCDIVRLLALEGTEADRPGLFVVGDPKQSIYGWRNADLAAYEEFLHQALEEGGQRLLLLQNFRSAPSILDEVDRVMPKVMVPETGLQPEFEKLVPSIQTRDMAGFTEQDSAPVEYWVSWRADTDDGGKSGPATLNDAAALVEAKAIAADIRRLHDDAKPPVAWSEFGILLRATSRLDTYLSALRDAGVPFVVGRDKQYFRKREIIEAAALVRAVLNPTDHLALLTFLRSAVVGVPDAALIPLWTRQLPDLVTGLTGANAGELDPIRRVITEAAADLPEGIPGLARIEGWEVSLEAAMTKLARLRRSFAEDPPDHFIERLRQLLLLEATEAARYLGPYRLANLERFFRSLESTLEECGGDYQAIQRTLRRSVQEAVEAEEALPKEAAEEAVQVVTIHSAKGLEFPHVYLVQLHAEPGGNDRKSVDVDERWRPGEPLEYTLFGSPTPEFYRVLEQRQRVAAAERVRTLYVAMTRAKKRLVLVGSWPEIPKEVEPLAAKSYLDLLASRPDLPASLGELRDQSLDGSAYVDAHETRWRFPDYLPREKQSIEQEASPSWLPTPQEVETASSTLVQRRAEATLRMSRPLSHAASAEAAERLQVLLAEEQTEEAGGNGDREAAMAVGTAIHRLFETWDVESQPAEELARGRESIRRQLEAQLGGDRLETALGRAEEILARLESGSLLERFVELGPSIFGREVPVLLPPGKESEALGFVSGTIDLLYRDPETGQPVIVDFKTDLVETEEELAARAEAYAAQEKVYSRAIQQALDLPTLPHTQLWFLWADQVWEG